MYTTTTPARIGPAVRRLIDTVTPGGQARYLRVRPEPGATVNECFSNVRAKRARDGGRMLCGWQLWEWPRVMVEAEFHAVWLSPEGEMVEITPKPHGETQVLFVPDERRRHDGTVVDNVRMALHEDQLIEHFIRVSGAIVQVAAHSGCATRHGRVWVPEEQIAPWRQVQRFLGRSIHAGLREDDPCPCGSGSHYRRCHGRELEEALA
ncbi:SEC-C domain-containing protein [Fulvimonas yonginensis]|uniref:SEC-C domain-containing protein n=1 Tax=Fulvimonas yonginensis TaxID=1495200 RepID=A0ABU8JE23_9GAMM